MKNVRHGYFFWGSIGLITLICLSGCTGTTKTVTATNTNTSSTTDDLFDPSSLVAAHNKWRAKVGVPSLKWSDNLAKSSKSWANTLRGRCIMKHSHGEPYGENIFHAGPLTQTDPSGRAKNLVQQVASKNVVDAWGEEKKWYNPHTNTCHGEECGHYTQVVWRDTKEVGCAMTLCKDNAQIWVCQYESPGNVQGQKPY